MVLPISVEDVKREVKILEALTGHENVVQFYNALEDDSYLYIAMELCEGGELLDQILAKDQLKLSNKPNKCFLKTTYVTLKFLLQALGDISTSDVDLAYFTKSIIVGFHVKAAPSIKKYASVDDKGVEIRLYKIIYEFIDDFRNAMEGLFETVEKQVPIGTAEVRVIFSSGSGRVVGCIVTEGKIVKDCGIQVLRKGRTIYVDVLGSLRRVKEVVKEVLRPGVP